MEERLDPARLARAVERLLGARPELAAPADPVDLDVRPVSPLFTHLELAGAGGDGRPRTAADVRWVLDRCLARSRGAALLVAYVDPGGVAPGQLVLACRGPAAVAPDTCAGLSRRLLELYAEIGGG